MNFLSYPGLQRFWTKVKNYVDTKIADSSGNKVTYSESERIVGTWIDGRPIYERTIIPTNIEKLTGSNSTSVYRYINGLQVDNIDKIISVSGMRGHYTNQYGWDTSMPIPNIIVDVNGNYVIIKGSVNYSDPGLESSVTTSIKSSFIKFQYLKA